MIKSGGSAAAPTPASSSPAEAAFSSSSSMLAGAASALAAARRRAIRIAAASVRLNAGRRDVGPAQPDAGQEDEPGEERARDRAEQVHRVQRADAQADAAQLPGMAHEVTRQDRQRRPHERRRHDQQAGRGHEAQHRQQGVTIAERRPQPAVEPGIKRDHPGDEQRVKPDRGLDEGVAARRDSPAGPRTCRPGTNPGPAPP